MADGVMNPQIGSRLTKIPLEILIRITYFISTEDLGHVRLTCRALERSLFTFFSHEFFRKKQFMAHTISLEALLAISRHPSLGPCLKHVVICTDRYIRRVPPPGVHDDVEKEKAFIGLCSENENIFSNGTLRDYLAEAFKNLPNLETVDIRDFNSRTRHRDGRVQATEWWTSYGSTTLAQIVGLRPPLKDRFNGENEITYRRQLFSAVVAALGTSGARPQALEVILKETGLTDAAFLIPARLEQPISQMLLGLTKLHLVLYTGVPLGPADSKLTQAFLRFTPNLTWLRLNRGGGAHHSTGSGVSIINWLMGSTYGSSAGNGTQDGDSTALDTAGRRVDNAPFQLQTLELGHFFLTRQQIVGLATRFAPTLRTLGIRWATLGCTTNELKDRVNVWQKVFEQLAKVPGLDLRTLHLAWLNDGIEPIFLVDNAQARHQQITYTGDSAAGLLAKVVAEIAPRSAINGTDSQGNRQSDNPGDDSEDDSEALEGNSDDVSDDEDMDD